MEPFWWSRDLTRTTPASQRTFEAFIGYILADSVWLLKNRKKWSGTTVYLWHHGASFACWGLVAQRGQAHGLGVALLLVEATAPFVNGRWFLSTLGHKSGALYMANGVLMALSFFALRVVFMGVVCAFYLVACRR